LKCDVAVFFLGLFEELFEVELAGYSTVCKIVKIG
jgi:hypothetical protein